MPIARARFSGSSNVGIYMRVIGRWVIIPRGSPQSLVDAVRECFSAQPFRTSVYQSSLMGIFLVGNESAILVPSLVSRAEFEGLSSGLDIPVHVLSSKMNALGNAILVNDYGALVHPSFPDKDVEQLERILKVKVSRGRVAGLSLPGSLAVVTNKGCILSHLATSEDCRSVSELFGVKCLKGTINNGLPYVKLGLVASDSGALMGRLTTPMEMNTIIEGLELE